MGLTQLILAAMQTPGYQTKTQSDRAWPIIVIPALFGLALFCVPLPQDHILSIHESVLPQTAKMMFYNGDWLIPRRDSMTPWLENPPLPQWITVSLCSLVGTCSDAWVARLAAAIAGALAVLLVTLMGVRLFGRPLGILSGLIMATSFEVVRYATLAEDEIFLALTSTAAMTCFVFAQFGSSRNPTDPATPVPADCVRFWGARPWTVVGLFAAAGLTNLTKGIGFGPLMVFIPVTTFILLTGKLSVLRRYLWAWGVMLFLLIGLWWPFAITLEVPGAIQLWLYDLFGRASGDYALMSKPFWYYAVALLQVNAPWILLAPVAFAATWRAALYDRESPERFLWLWAFSVPLVLSFFSGKHHHYLLHSVAPWAMLAALGLKRMASRLPVICRSPRVATSILFGALSVIYGGLLLSHRTVHHDDGKFTQAIADAYPSGPFFVDHSITDDLKGLQILFYLPQKHTRGLHNLSFLRAKEITEDRVYVITEQGRHDALANFGDVTQLLQSRKTGRQTDPQALLTLFELTYHDALERFSTEGLVITPMQAMYRAPGPNLQLE